MPDISKLSQLCEILEISIDELLGAQPAAGTIKKVLKNEEDAETEPVSMEELAEVAQLLPPKEVCSIVEESAKCSEEELPLSTIQALAGLAPFLPKETLHKLAEYLLKNGDCQGLQSLIRQDM